MAVTLLSISRRFVKRSNDCLQRYNVALNIPIMACGPTHAQSKERLVFALHDTWCQFAREYFVVSAFRCPEASGGARLTKAPSCATFDGTIRQMRVVTGHRAASNWIPKWHFPNTLVDLAVRLNLANEPIISGVLSLPQADVLNDLTSVRNYVAHRNRSAVAVYAAFTRRVAVPPSTPASDIIDNRSFYGTTMYEHWVTVLQYLAQTLA